MLIVATLAWSAFFVQNCRAEMSQEMGSFARAAGQLSSAAGMLWDVLAAIPRIPDDLARAMAAVVASRPSGIDPALVVGIAAAIGALVIFMPTLLDRLAMAWVTRHVRCEAHFSRALRLIGFDVAAFLISAVVALLLVHAVYKRDFLIGGLAVTLVGAAVRWRLVMLAIEILLRPAHPEFRLVPVDTVRATEATRVLGLALALGALFISIAPVLLKAGLEMRTAQAIALIVGTLVAIGAAYAVHRLLSGLSILAEVAGQLLVLLIWLAWSASVTLLDFDVYHGLVWSIGIIAATIGVDRLLALARQPPANGAVQPSHTRLVIVTTLRRIVLAVAGTLVAGLIARLWLVDLLGVVSTETWGHVRQAVITALAVLVVGYIAFELMRAWTEHKFGHHYATALPGPDDEEATPASRLSSVLPLLQGALGVMILAIAVLLALSHLGINVTPLIAGAGIFGLALSFGSQALVRDIVAGLFYIFDDAFRVGEYIEAGKYKGTVERIALRSTRLRHQNGQFHTVPYGQLGAVTNYSRDFSTIKFNLRLTRDTDIDKVRKLTKKLGQQLLQDPEIGKEFILPLKLQGLADIQENALVCRFKFTVRPNRPTVVQRAALNRLYRVLVQAGIAFASNAVVVQSPAGVPPELAAAAATTRPGPGTGTTPAQGNGSPASRT
jgi:small-conductance mechanosensitive channel